MEAQMALKFPKAKTVLKFDYTAIEDPDTRKAAQEAALRIHDNLIRSKEAFLEVGRDLLAMKDEIMHGGFQPWLGTEFPLLKYRTAINYMNAYTYCEEHPDAKLFDLTAIYALASKSTPPEVVEEVFEQVKAGTVPTVKEIKAKVKEARQASKLEAKKPELKVIEGTPIDGRKQAAADALALLQEHLSPAILADFAKLVMTAEDAFLPALAETLKKAAA
jgi:hypothetical protein